jgi:hypothetical protein
VLSSDIFNQASKFISVSEEMRPQEREKHPSAQTVNETPAITDEERIVLLITGDSHEGIFESAALIKNMKESLPTGLDFRIPGMKERLKSIQRKGGGDFGVFNVTSVKEARIAIRSGARSRHCQPWADPALGRKCLSPGRHHRQQETK